MIVGSADFTALEDSWQAIFHKQLDEDPQGTLALIRSMSMQVNSDGSSEDYTDFNVDVSLREWVGERAFGTAATKTINVPNKTYEAGIKVQREVIEDDRMGIYESEIMGLADAVNRGLRRDGVNMLLNGNVANADAPTFDGGAFFQASHNVGGAAPAAQSNITVGALTSANLAAAKKTMMQLVNHNNEALEITPDHLIVGPELEATAEAILDQQFLATGESNLDFKRYKWSVVNTFGSADDWFLLDSSKALKPLIFQNRRSPQFEKLTVGSEHTMLKNEFLYGTSTRYAYGYGVWQVIHGGFPA
jgi:phage major head subunit gpT-like protein